MSGIKVAVTSYVSSFMVTTTLPTPLTAPHRSLRATGVRDDSEEEAGQEKRQLSLNTMSTRLDIGGSHRSRGSVIVTPNKKGSGEDPRIGIVGGLKAHENVLKTSNDDDDVNCRDDTLLLASDGQNVETSKNRSIDKMKVDPAFVVLSPRAQEFLQAQGIASALNFIAINANDLAPAWIEWNEGAFKTNKAISDLQCWKRKVRYQWSSSSAKGATPPLSNHAVTEAVLKQSSVAEAEAPTVEVVPALRFLESAPLSNHVTEAVLKQSSVAEALAPIIEVVPALRVLGSEAREFLIAQGIATVEAFLSTKSRTMADALMDWRARSKKEPSSFIVAQNCIYKWKRRLRDRQ
jgi:hypothetical protein